MFEISLQSGVMLFGVAILTAMASFWDWKERRIPNKLTIPVFFCGWIYQAVFNQWAGLADGGLGFLVGFGTLFVLWMVGGGGGGDVKLMGALSVWLGFRLTLMVMIVSTVLVIMATAAVMVYSMVSLGPSRMKRKLLATGKPTKPGEKPKPETTAQKSQRRVMAYAIPVTVATWMVLIWKLPVLP